MAERTYRIHIASELSGVRVELIRAWERRYGIPAPPAHSLGLPRVHRAGRGAAQAAEAAHRGGRGHQRGGEAGAPARGGGSPTRVEAPAAEVSATSRRPWRAAVLAAAAAHDQARVSAGAGRGALRAAAAEGLRRGARAGAVRGGRALARGPLTVAQEHLVSQVVRARMVGLLHAAPENEGARHARAGVLPGRAARAGAAGRGAAAAPRGPPGDAAGAARARGGLSRKLVAELRPDLVGLSAVTDPGPAAFEQQVAQVLERAAPRDTGVDGGRCGRDLRARCASGMGARVFRAGDDWSPMLA